MDLRSLEGGLADASQVGHPTVLVEPSAAFLGSMLSQNMLSVNRHLHRVELVETIAGLVVNNGDDTVSAKYQVHNANTGRQTFSQRQDKGFFDAEHFITSPRLLHKDLNGVSQVTPVFAAMFVGEEKESLVSNRKPSGSSVVQLVGSLMKSPPFGEVSGFRLGFHSCNVLKVVPIGAEFDSSNLAVTQVGNLIAVQLPHETLDAAPMSGKCAGDGLGASHAYVSLVAFSPLIAGLKEANEGPPCLAQSSRMELVGHVGDSNRGITEPATTKPQFLRGQLRSSVRLAPFCLDFGEGYRYLGVPNMPCLAAA